jgi:hypothetical protein
MANTGRSSKQSIAKSTRLQKKKLKGFQFETKKALK